MKCPQCGVEVVEAAMFCQACGADLRAAGATADDPRADAATSESSATRPSPPGASLREKHRQAAGGAEDSERELWSGGFSPKAMVGKAVVAGLATIVIIGVAIAVGGAAAWWVALGVIALGWLYLAGQLAYRRLSVHYRATSQMLYHESGILWKTTDRIEIIDMDDISYRQGIIDRMFGIGTLTIRSSDVSDPIFQMVGIEDIREVAARLDRARREERNRRGLYIEQV